MPHNSRSFFRFLLRFAVLFQFKAFSSSTEEKKLKLHNAFLCHKCVSIRCAVLLYLDICVENEMIPILHFGLLCRKNAAFVNVKYTK